MRTFVVLSYLIAAAAVAFVTLLFDLSWKVPDDLVALLPSPPQPPKPPIFFCYGGSCYDSMWFNVASAAAFTTTSWTEFRYFGNLWFLVSVAVIIVDVVYCYSDVFRFARLLFSFVVVNGGDKKAIEDLMAVDCLK